MVVGELCKYLAKTAKAPLAPVAAPAIKTEVIEDESEPAAAP
jgi:hypothetical protein